MGKVDLKKELGHLYSPSTKEVVAVDVPPMYFLMIDGSADPNTSREYQEAIEALYAVSYTLKFMVKKGDAALDYTVMPLEGLWWMEDMEQFTTENKALWQWTAMIMQPEHVTADLVTQALKEVETKKNPPALPKIRFETYHEGLAVQTMHTGPYDAERPTIARMHSFAREQGYRLVGKHHEIYLSDPRRTAPEKWKTVLRQPVAPQ